MKPMSAVAYGINGVKVRDGLLYYTNGAQNLFAKFPISQDGTATGPVAVISNGVASDDFPFETR